MNKEPSQTKINSSEGLELDAQIQQEPERKNR